MIAMSNLLPQDGLSTRLWMLKSHLDFLRNRSKVQQLVQLFHPVIRAFARTAGEAVSMPVRRLLIIFSLVFIC
uniref:Putative ovule protein n=1 Tax=Solanum chacoense TaxID=4108 RepID=A0A0V0GU64_SOLCH